VPVIEKLLKTNEFYFLTHGQYQNKI